VQFGKTALISGIQVGMASDDLKDNPEQVRHMIHLKLKLIAPKLAY
jgi:hypothetical protein